jgi:hypothetical protein
MEPTQPSMSGSPEVGPIIPNLPEAPLRAPEHTPESQSSVERPAPQEHSSDPRGAAAPPPMPTIPLPTSPTMSTDDSSDDSDDDNPAVAADDDLIEKEWVQKTKQVISETKHDPYAQELAITQIQADYLRKRYGKIIKIPDGE